MTLTVNSMVHKGLQKYIIYLHQQILGIAIFKILFLYDISVQKHMLYKYYHD